LFVGAALVAKVVAKATPQLFYKLSFYIDWPYKYSIKEKIKL
jgi:hypothetical protein